MSLDDDDDDDESSNHLIFVILELPCDEKRFNLCSSDSIKILSPRAEE